MRVLILLSLVMSFEAFAQTRVRENIKQKSGVSYETESGQDKEVKDRKGKQRKRR